MTTLEIILIIYICVSQISSMVILSSSLKNNRQIKLVLFAVLNPLGILTAYVIDHIHDKKEKTNEKDEESI